LYKGLEPLEYGVDSVRTLNNRLAEFSKEINELEIVMPDYKVIHIDNVKADK